MGFSIRNRILIEKAMAIKNWTVTAETTRSAAAREIYFNDADHKNHINTESILQIFGNQQSSLNIIYQCEKRKLELALQRKGGRPPTEAMEFVFTLPKGIRPSREEWHEMMMGVVRQIAAVVKVNPKEFNGITRAVVHRQKQDIDGGTGDHCHMMLGKFTNTGRYLPELQRKGVLHQAKMAFNAEVLRVMGVSHDSYEAKKKYEGIAKKRVPKWVVDSARAAEKLKNEQDLFELEKINYLGEVAQKEKIMSRFLIRSADLLKYLEDGDKRAKSTVNRINKDMKQLVEAFESNPEAIETVGGFAKSINNAISKSPNLTDGEMIESAFVAAPTATSDIDEINAFEASLPKEVKKVVSRVDRLESKI